MLVILGGIALVCGGIVIGFVLAAWALDRPYPPAPKQQRPF